MTMTVITLSKVRPGIRGYLTRWMVEISSGVFVGSFNRKVREKLWAEITTMTRQGEVTIAFSIRGEQGFQIEVAGGSREARDHDGVTLVWKPSTV